MTDRRTFLGASAAAAAHLLLARNSLADTPATKRRNLKKAVKFGMIAGDGSVLDKLTLLRDLGFDGVEIDSPSNLDLDEVLEAMGKTGIDVHGVVDSVHWKQTLSHPDREVRAKGRAGLETALRDAKKVGASTVLLVPGVVNKQVSYEQAYLRSQTEVSRVLPLAEELGVKIAFENVWNQFLLSPLEAARYVDELESNMVGWYFDVGNVVNYGWPEQWVRILGHRILKLDIKEYSRKRRNDEGLWKGFQVKLLEGDCDWPAVMAAVDEIGYEGWGTAEIAGGGPERLEEIAERMDRIFAS